MDQHHVQHAAAGIFGVMSWALSDWISTFNAVVGDISFYGGAAVVVWTLWRMWRRRNWD